MYNFMEKELHGLLQLEYREHSLSGSRASREKRKKLQREPALENNYGTSALFDSARIDLH